MWKGVIVIILSFPLSIISLMIGWIASGWRTGVIVALTIISIAIVIATLILFFTKQLSVIDCFLPTILAIVWSIILVPFSLGTAVFSIPAVIGSSIILSICLWRVRQDGIGKGWLILPIIMYIYEMLPINIPGPFDDYFAFGGDLTNLILLSFASSSGKQLPETKQEPRDKLIESNENVSSIRNAWDEFLAGLRGESK